MTSQQLTFGKYKGMSINLVPAEYLLWLASQSWMRQQHPELYRFVCKRSVSYLRSVLLDL